MRRFVTAGLLATICAVFVAAIGASTADAARGKKCAKVVLKTEPYYVSAIKIRALGARCATARRLARRYHRATPDPRRKRFRLAGFRCRRKWLGYEAARMTCRRGSRVVRFTWVSTA